MSAAESAGNGPVDSQSAETQRHAARQADTARVVDTERVERAVRELLSAIGEDPDRPGLVDTPARVARACTEIFAGVGKDPDAVLDAQFAEDFHEMVVVRDITFYSMCEHHLLPFFGVAHIVYIPGEEGKVTGLSKLARLVEGYARRPQVQERLTTQIANALRDRLGAAGVLVVVEAEHMCMTMRGVCNSGSRTVTSAVRGMLRKPSTRAEAMSLIERGA
ncbi:GTP cyclohydrolase I FolE [Actinotignum schaalii]|uniref:GTP cyclohydrolase 1 n=1 Tax=Actinotignum schaalii FB123-CNA-2 TaxID=883067 RepID=S2VP96_9ACTO|nr:GTP cyclohydrolase I FolE [Actinotignum schaalii]EPD28636.1 GTP cyclohydrolase I [Actinotignum schaalii FB123-CNA-2]